MERKSESPGSKPDARIQYLIFWWQNQVPYAMMLDDEIQAYAAANIRNAALVEIAGKDARVTRAVDYYRRDDKGTPLPFVWRNISPPQSWPWMPRPMGTIQ